MIDPSDITILPWLPTAYMSTDTVVSIYKIPTAAYIMQ